ncbi:hypothetical protein BSKO_01898 [Bryopsis sp. KO-2023]|nr:hypothetical protein BSKO_01898 [Bryopsis sp. KO-2023]
MECSNRYGEHLDVPMEKQMVSWLKEIGYRGEGLKAGNLRRLCNDEDIIDALFFLMQRMRSKEEARVFRTQLGQLETLDEAKSASKKARAAKMREARKERQLYEDRSRRAFEECKRQAQWLKGMQNTLVEQESRWRYEAKVTIKERKLQRRVLKGFKDKVSGMAGEFDGRMEGLRRIVRNGKLQRQEGGKLLRQWDARNFHRNHKKLKKVVAMAEDSMNRSQPWSKDAGIPWDGKNRKLSLPTIALDGDVQMELAEILTCSGGHCLAQSLGEFARLASLNFRNKLQEGDLNSSDASPRKARFQEAQAMLDKLHSLHVAESLEKEKILNQAHMVKSRKSNAHGIVLEWVNVDNSRKQRLELMGRLALMEADCMVIREEMESMRKEEGPQAAALKTKARSLRANCDFLMKRSIDLDGLVEDTVRQLGKSRQHLLKMRKNNDNYYAFKIMHQCDRVIGQSKKPSDLMEEVECMEKMKLGNHPLRQTAKKGFRVEGRNRRSWEEDDGEDVPALQQFEWALQERHFFQTTLGATDFDKSKSWRLLKVMTAIAKEYPTAAVWSPDHFFKKVRHIVLSLESSAIIGSRLLKGNSAIREDIAQVKKNTSIAQEKHKFLCTTHSEEVWEGLESVFEKATNLDLTLKKEVRKALENYVELPILKKAIFMGLEGHGGTIAYWMSQWDDATGYIRFRKGLGGRQGSYRQR